MFARLGTFIILCTALVFAATAAQATSPIVLQLKWKPQFQFAGYYAAQAKGFYKEEGLDVQIRSGQPHITPVESVVSGEADFAVVAAADALHARIDGQPLIALAVIYQHSPYVYLTRSQAINRPSDLLGKTIMIVPGQGEIELRAVLLNEGLSDKSLRIVEHTWNVNDLIEGKVDAMSAYLTDNYKFFSQPEILAAGQIRPINYGIDFYGDTLIASERTTIRSQEQVEAFIRASLRGWKYAFDHEAEIIDLLLSLPEVKNRGIDREYLKYEATHMRELILPDLVELGHMNPGRWQHMLDTYARLGLSPPGASLDNFIYSIRPQAALFKRLVLGLCITLALAIVAGLWVVLLRRAVRQRTGELRREIELRKEQEQALLSSEQRYRSLLAVAPLPIMVHRDGILLFLNPAGARMLQQASGESLLGRSLGDFVPSDEERAWLLHSSKESESPGDLQRFPLRICLASGELRNLEVASISMDYDGCGSCLMVCTDVTEKLATEHELAEYRNQLEKLVEERTTALLDVQEQLRLKERLAVIGQLTATVSHELRNPLGSISNALFNLQQALAAKREDLTVKSLQVAVRNVERCDRIINELLDYSRKGELVDEEIIVDRWLRELIDELVWPAQIGLRTELHSGAVIQGDGDRLRRAILNLINNAQQALLEVDQEEKVVLVATRAGNDRLEIIIEDNGPGIPEDLQAKIFEPLFSTKVYGVGLGMPVVADVMSCHHGGIELQTPEGGGCRFILWLPIGDKEGRADGC